MKEGERLQLKWLFSHFFPAWPDKPTLVAFPSCKVWTSRKEQFLYFYKHFFIIFYYDFFTFTKSHFPCGLIWRILYIMIKPLTKYNHIFFSDQISKDNLVRKALSPLKLRLSHFLLFANICTFYSSVICKKFACLIFVHRKILKRYLEMDISWTQFCGGFPCNTNLTHLPNLLLKKEKSWPWCKSCNLLHKLSSSSLYISFARSFIVIKTMVKIMMMNIIWMISDMYFGLRTYWTLLRVTRH